MGATGHATDTTHTCMSTTARLWRLAFSDKRGGVRGGVDGRPGDVPRRGHLPCTGK